MGGVIVPLPPVFTRAGFREAAKSIRVHLDGEPVGFMVPTETPGGALAWKLSFSAAAAVAGCTVQVRYTLTATVVGSAALPPATAHEPEPAPPAGALFPTT